MAVHLVDSRAVVCLARTLVSLRLVLPGPTETTTHASSVKAQRLLAEKLSSFMGYLALVFPARLAASSTTRITSSIPSSALSPVVFDGAIRFR